MSHRPWPLVRVLLAWSAGVVALALVLASALVLVSEDRFLDREVRRQGETLGQALAALAVGPAPAAAGDLAVSRAPDLVAASVTAPDGSVLWRFGPSEDEVRASGPGPLAVVEREVRVMDAASGTVAPVRIRLLLSTRRLRLHLLETGLKMVFSLGAGLAALLLLGLVAVDRLAAPVERLARWARTFREGGGAEPPPSGGSREVQELARAFGELIGRLERERSALEASEARLRELFQVAPAPMLVVDGAGRVERANQAAEPFLGVPVEQAAGLELARFVDTPDAVAGEGVREVRWRLPGGGIAPLEVAARPGLGPGGGGVLLVLHDLTDRLRRIGERWRRTFDALEDGVGILGDDGRPALQNRRMEAWWPALERELGSFLPGDGGGERRLELEGRALLVRVSEGPEGRLVVVRDITERERAEASLNRALRAEAVAALAAGVAHDFNNLLAAVELHLRLVANDPAGAEDSVAAIRELVTRGREVVEQLLAEAREQEEERRPVDLDELLARSESFLRFLLEPAVVVRVERPGTPLTVCGSPTALRRVLLNLAVNARRVLEDRLGAALWVSLRRSGGEAEIVVEDNGPGLPAGDPTTLFQPRVSGRDGHGLGLAVVSSLVAEHGGRILASKSPRGGARFTVFLPLAGGGGCEPSANEVP